MLTASRNALICVIPVVVLWSGMATTPILFLLTLLIAAALPRSAYGELRRELASYRAVWLVLAIVLGWAAISSLWSVLPARSLGGTGRILAASAAGLFAFMAVPKLPPISPSTLRYFACGILLSSAIVLFEKLSGGGLIRVIYSDAAQYQRFLDKTVNRGLCALTVLVWPLVGGLYAIHRRRLAWLVILVLALAVFAMHSLSAKLGMAAGVAVFAAIHVAPRTMPRLLTVALPLFLLAFPLVFAVVEQRLFTETVRAKLPESSVHRLQIWHESLIQAQERPLHGWGMDTSRAVPVSEATRTELGWKAQPLHPHNSSVQLLLELGAVGLVLAAAGLAWIMASWEKATRGQGAMRLAGGALFAAYFGTGLSSFGVWQSWWFAALWLTAILVHYMARARA